MRSYIYSRSLINWTTKFFFEKSLCQIEQFRKFYPKFKDMFLFSVPHIDFISLFFVSKQPLRSIFYFLLLKTGNWISFCWRKSAKDCLCKTVRSCKTFTELAYKQKVEEIVTKKKLIEKRKIANLRIYADF